MCVTFQINVIVCDCPIDCLRQEVLLRVRLLPDGEQERNQETQADRQTGTGTDQKIIVNWEFVKTFDSTPSLRLNLSLPLFCQTGWRRLRLCIYLPFFASSDMLSIVVQVTDIWPKTKLSISHLTRGPLARR